MMQGVKAREVSALTAKVFGLWTWIEEKRVESVPGGESDDDDAVSRGGP